MVPPSALGRGWEGSWVLNDHQGVGCDPSPLFLTTTQETTLEYNEGRQLEAKNVNGLLCVIEGQLCPPESATHEAPLQFSAILPLGCDTAKTFQLDCPLLLLSQSHFDRGPDLPSRLPTLP